MNKRRALHHFEKDNPSLREVSPGRRVFYFPLFSKDLRPFHIFYDPFTTRRILPLFLALILCLPPDSLASKDEAEVYLHNQFLL